VLHQLLPSRLDNNYRGRKLALWLFGLVVLIRSIQSTMIIVNGYSIATSADGIPPRPTILILDPVATAPGSDTLFARFAG
jgi:hypothetical protein